MESSMKIYKDLRGVMSEIEAVTKSKINQQQNYKYRSIDDVYNMIQPIFGKHGIFIVPKVIEIKEDERQSKSGGVLNNITLTMEYSFYADDGSSLSTIAVGKAMDSGDKALDKAKSSAMKYLLLQMFLIPTEEDKDIEKDNPEPKKVDKPKPSQPESPAPKPDLNSMFSQFTEGLNGIDNIFELEGWGKKHKKDIEMLAEPQQIELRKLYASRQKAIAEQAPATEKAAGSLFKEDGHNPPE